MISTNGIKRNCLTEKVHWSDDVNVQLPFGLIIKINNHDFHPVIITNHC